MLSYVVKGIIDCIQWIRLREAEVSSVRPSFNLTKGETSALVSLHGENLTLIDLFDNKF